MIRPTGRLLWFLFRVLAYLAVVVALFMSRGSFQRPGGGRLFPVFPERDSSLVIAGRDLAPELIRRLVEDYRQDYPHLRVQVHGGGTAQALEALANSRADVAFLIRPPTRREQDLIRSARGDTAVWFPVALGGIMVIRGQGSAVDSLGVDGLVRFVREGDRTPPFDRVYIPDPNTGLWDALAGRLGLPPERLGHPGSLVVLRDEAGVIGAVRTDRRGLGVVSSLSLPAADVGKLGLKAVRLAVENGRPAAPPTYEDVGHGRYPLYHYLYAACRAEGGMAGTMFLTHLTSDRGQRQIERAGVLPARQVLREIYLTTRPLGQTK